jgi:hypothetical protein
VREEGIVVLNDEIAVALRAWQRETERLATIIEAFPEEALDDASACGDWTNRELLAHIATGYAARAAVLRALIAGGEAPTEDETHAANISANISAQVRLLDVQIEEVAAELRRQRDGIARLLRALRNEHLDVITPLSGGDRPLREILDDLSDHDTAHAAELRPAPA